MKFAVSACMKLTSPFIIKWLRCFLIAAINAMFAVPCLAFMSGLVEMPLVVGNGRLP